METFLVIMVFVGTLLGFGMGAVWGIWASAYVRSKGGILKPNK